MGRPLCVLVLLLGAVYAQLDEPVVVKCCNHDGIQPLVDVKTLNRCQAYEEMGQDCPYPSSKAAGVSTDSESSVDSESSDDDDRRLDLGDGDVWVPFQITPDFSAISDAMLQDPDIVEIKKILEDVILWYSKALKVRQFDGDSTILIPSSWDVCYESSYPSSWKTEGFENIGILF
jgi:hypothetical protein